MKKYLLFIALCFISSISFAQRKQATDEYSKNAVEAIPYSSMPGKVSYGYIVDEDGTNLKDGPFSIKCGLTNYKFKLSPYVVTLNGSFTVTTTFSKGNINGPFSAYYKLNVTGTTLAGVSKDGISNSMTGSFINGVPNGAFKVSRNGEIKSSLTANYKKGILVGAYSCSLFDDDAKLVKYSGTLTQSGKFTGAWKMNDFNCQFQNGVLISETNGKTSTKPAITELARKYAAGQITKEQLLHEKSVVVKTQKVLLGDYARIAIFRDSGVEFKKIGGYDFSIPNEVTYEYLEEVAIISDKAFEELKKAYFAYYAEDLSDVDCDFLYSKRIFDEFTTAPYVEVYKNNEDAYIMKGKPHPYYSSIATYIPYDKFKVVADEIETTLIAKAKTVKEFMINSKIGIGSSLIEKYLKGDFSSIGLNSSNWNQLIRDIQFGWEKFNKFSEPHPTNENIIVIQRRYDDGRIAGKKYYVLKNSLDEYATIVNNIQNDVEKIQTDLKQQFDKEQLKKAIDFIKTNRTHFSISYDDKVCDFFYHSNSSKFNLEFNKRLKPFCPIADFEIIGFDGDKVVCKITKKGKKKELISYEIALEHNNGKFSVESFDIANAKVVE